MLMARGLTKEFQPGSRVLERVDVSFAAGEIHALLGANGAGKSTLCKIIAGLHQATAGEMTWQGKPYSPFSKQDAERHGVQIVQQELNLVPTLDVAHNLFLSRLPHRWGWIDQRTLYANARRLLDAFGLSQIDPREKVGSYGVGERQMLEIAANLDRTCPLLILDEPTAALSIRETELLFEKLRIARDQGTAIVYISHRLEEVLKLADRATVLRDGRLVGTYAIDELTESRLVALMTRGEDDTEPHSSAATAENSRERSNVPADRPFGMSVRNVCAGPRVRDVTFSVYQGEILGIAGLVGSGRSELLRALFGADSGNSGEVLLGTAANSPSRSAYSKTGSAETAPVGTWRGLFASPAEAVRAGLVMITEDRKADGLLLPRSIGDNMVLSQLANRHASDPRRSPRRPWGGYDPRRAADLTDEYRTILEIRSRDHDQAVGTLSGGNQQKVVLAKWLLRGADVWLLDEPTRGIDVASRELIYRVLRELAAAGKSLVVVSSDLEELMRHADRIGVLSNGRWITEFSGPQYSRAALTAAMFAGYGDKQLEKAR